MTPQWSTAVSTKLDSHRQDSTIVCRSVGPKESDTRLKHLKIHHEPNVKTPTPQIPTGDGDLHEPRRSWDVFSPTWGLHIFAGHDKNPTRIWPSDWCCHVSFLKPWPATKTTRCPVASWFPWVNPEIIVRSPAQLALEQVTKPKRRSFGCCHRWCRRNPWCTRHATRTRWRTMRRWDSGDLNWQAAVEIEQGYSL